MKKEFWLTIKINCNRKTCGYCKFGLGLDLVCPIFGQTREEISRYTYRTPECLKSAKEL